jgi:hypothetical protein
LRDKLEIPSLDKADPADMMSGMPGMSEAQTTESGESDAVVGESTIGKMLSSSVPVSAENLDFSEFDESGDLKDQTTRDKVSKKIAERFNRGGLDEVGWERLATGISSSDAESSRIDIDEYTSPGDIIYTVKRLLDEIRAIPREIPPGANSLRMELVQYENSVLRGDELDPQQVTELVRIYSLSYRLNRSYVHRECVVLDPESTGYWSYFAPYYM